MKRISLVLALAFAAALLLTGCFGSMQPAPTPTVAAPTDEPVVTGAPESSAVPETSGLPDASATPVVDLTPDATAYVNEPGVSDGLNVAPSPSASTAP